MQVNINYIKNILNMMNINIQIIKISEIDCKTPDQIRFIIRINQQNIDYNNSADQNVILISLYIFILFIFQILM